MTIAPWYAPYRRQGVGLAFGSGEPRRPGAGLDRQSGGDGLSRSGKTVFITSLIHNLLSAVHNPNRMPLLGVVGDGRLMGARLESAGAGRLPRFRYQENIEAMAAGAPVVARGHRRPARDRHRDPLHAGERARQAAQRDQRQPGDASRCGSSTIPANGCSTCRCWGSPMRSGRARRCGSTGAACAPRRRPTSSPSSAQHPPRRDRERRDREAGARPLPRLPGQGARRARPELSAAGALPVSGQPRRCAVPLVRAARRSRQRARSRRTRSAR